MAFLPHFNSRPSARGDTSITSISALKTHFNSRPSARGDCAAVCYKILIVISIHAPPRGATNLIITDAKQHRLFQFTPLREGRRDGHTMSELMGKFQFTPLREGRQYTVTTIYKHHLFQFTPLREGRRHGRCGVQTSGISIHAPPRGATITYFWKMAMLTYFNSRPSARGDGKRYAISANLLFNPYKSAWLNNSATQFVEIILVIFHRIIA